ncbi:hypothetical protein ES703_70295 [subsurface metagenome]
MIDDIVQMILKEARGREGHTATFNIYRVCREIDGEIIQIIDNIQEEERRKEEDENKTETQAKEAGQENTD